MTKAKATDEANEQTVDDGTVDNEAGADAPAQVTDLEGNPVATDEDGLPLLEENPGNPDLAAAQGILGVTVTGFSNHATKMALRAYQRAHGLSPTGQFDPRTRQAMRL